MHPLLHLIVKQPQLLSEHAEAYVELFGEELGMATTQWKRRATLSAIGAFSASVGIVLAGVALMLWAVVPADTMNSPWALLVVPLVPVAAAVACFVMARQRPETQAFDNMRRQLREDVAMFREANAS